MTKLVAFKALRNAYYVTNATLISIFFFALDDKPTNNLLAIGSNMTGYFSSNILNHNVCVRIKERRES